MDPTSQALLDIVMCYSAGQGGDAAASFVRTKYPQVVAGLIPLLQNKEQVIMFAKTTAPLSEIAGDEDFPQFFDEFIQEMLHPDEEPAGDPPPAA